MQAMAGRCGAWGWTCALSATVGVVACISLPCNPINSNTIPENAAPLAAPKTHRVRVEFVRVFLLAAHRVLLAGARRRPATNKVHHRVPEQGRAGRRWWPWFCAQVVPRVDGPVCFRLAYNLSVVERSEDFLASQFSLLVVQISEADYQRSENNRGVWWDYRLSDYNRKQTGPMNPDSAPKARVPHIICWLTVSMFISTDT